MMIMPVDLGDAPGSYIIAPVRLSKTFLRVSLILIDSGCRRCLTRGKGSVCLFVRPAVDDNYGLCASIYARSKVLIFV